MIYKLVDPEQKGFIPVRGDYDNIIAAQKISHSLEFDSSVIPRILKTDVEKAFDTI